jgi:hypothetical protein
LPHDEAAPGANRCTNRDLFLTSGSAREQQAGDVRAGDQQDEADRTEQDQERGANIFDNQILHRDDGRVLVAAHPARIGFAKVFAEDLHFCARLFDGHARLQPRGDREEVPLIRARGVGLERQEQVGVG